MQRIEMYIRAGSVKGVLVTARNQQIATPPAITRGIRGELAVRLLEENGAPLSGLGNYASWDFAIANDWDTETAPQIHVSEGITAEGNLVTVPLLETNTQELKEALGTRESALFGCELAGYEAGEETPGFLVQFDIVIRNRRHTAESAEPVPIDDSSYQAAQIRALFAAALEVELSDDRETWYPVPDSGEAPFTARWFRIRNAAAGRDWSEAIPLPSGGGGSGGEPAFEAWLAEDRLVAGERAVADGPSTVAIGSNAVATGGNGSITAVGPDTRAEGSFTTAVGNYCTEATGTYSAAFGSWAKAYGNSCVQLGTGENHGDETLQFRSYRLLESDGTIPAERLPTANVVAGMNPETIAQPSATPHGSLCGIVADIVRALRGESES